jgi:hypothetical protein
MVWGGLLATQVQTHEVKKSDIMETANEREFTDNNKNK